MNETFDWLGEEIMKNRPFIVEFAGTPRAGKDSTIDVLNRLFHKRLGLRVGVVDEVIRNWRVRDRRSTKKTLTVARQVLKSIHHHNPGDNDVIFINRGLFDRLAFLTYESHLGLNNGKKRYLPEFKQDLTVLMLIPPTTSLSRYYHPQGVGDTLNQIVCHFDGPQSSLPSNYLLREDRLTLLNEAYRETKKEYQSYFSPLLVLDQSDGEDLNLFTKTQMVLQAMATVFHSRKNCNP